MTEQTPEEAARLKKVYDAHRRALEARIRNQKEQTKHLESSCQEAWLRYGIRVSESNRLSDRIKELEARISELEAKEATNG